jgi:hypothetical protein
LSFEARRRQVFAHSHHCESKPGRRERRLVMVSASQRTRRRWHSGKDVREGKVNVSAIPTSMYLFSADHDPDHRERHCSIPAHAVLKRRGWHQLRSKRRIGKTQLLAGVHLLRTSRPEDAVCWWCSNSRKSVPYLMCNKCRSMWGIPTILHTARCCLNVVADSS